MSTAAHADNCSCSREPLQREGSVPIMGFSRELRNASDAQRFWFFFALRGDVSMPVHLVFSPIAAAAEIKAADLKAYRVDGVTSACEARERWMAWWQKHRTTGGSTGPRRTGNAPRLVAAT